MHAIDFIQDLAVIMLIAGFVTILCHRFKQPVVLGYIIAGVIIGLPTLRLRGDYIAIVTLAFGEIIGQVAANGDQVKIGGLWDKTLGKLPLIPDLTNTKEKKQLHRITVVLMNTAGHRIGESAWELDVRIPKASL